MLCSTSESSHVVLFRVRVTRGFEGASYSNWATSAYHLFLGHEHFSRAVGSKARNETNRMPPVPQNIDDWLYLLYVSIFWRSWNLRLFLVHHKKYFCIFEVFNNHRAYIAHLPKTFPGICDALNNYFGKSKMISCNPIEHAYRFPTLYQTTILGTRWDLEDTRVINIKKSCQANYQ